MKECIEQECTEPAHNSSRCKTHYNSYMNQYMKERYHRRRKEFIAELGGKCVDCGSTEDLEFDHVDSREKSFNIAKVLSSGSDARIRNELDKCVLRCNKHHKEKSDREKDNRSVEHGEGLTGKRNCRCKLCAPLKNKYSREHKLKQKNGSLV